MHGNEETCIRCIICADRGSDGLGRFYTLADAMGTPDSFDVGGWLAENGIDSSRVLGGWLVEGLLERPGIESVSVVISFFARGPVAEHRIGSGGRSHGVEGEDLSGGK